MQPQVVLGGFCEEAMYAPQGETGFVNNVGSLFWLVGLVLLFLFSFEAGSMLGLHCCTGLSLVVGSWWGWWSTLSAVCALLIAVASVVPEHGLSSGLRGLGCSEAWGIFRTRDRTCNPCIAKADDSSPLDHQGSPKVGIVVDILPPRW